MDQVDQAGKALTWDVDDYLRAVFDTAEGFIV